MQTTLRFVKHLRCVSLRGNESWRFIYSKPKTSSHRPPPLPASPLSTNPMCVMGRPLPTYGFLFRFADPNNLEGFFTTGCRIFGFRSILGIKPLGCGTQLLIHSLSVKEKRLSLNATSLLCIKGSQAFSVLLCSSRPVRLPSAVLQL